MFHKKKLAYGDGEKRGSLAETVAFCSLTLVLSSCATHALRNYHRPSPERTGHFVRAVPIDECSSRLSGVLEPGETVLQHACRSDNDYFLTDRSLIVMPRESVLDGIGLRYAFSRANIRQFLERGVISWDAGDNACYFITRDGVLTVLPNERMTEDDAKGYVMPFDVREMAGRRMIYFGHLIFIAPPQGDIMVVSPSDRGRAVRMSASTGSGQFFVRDDRLYFGQSGIEETEIRINGGIDGITLERR